MEECGAAVEAVDRRVAKPFDQPDDDALDAERGVPFAVDVQVDAEDAADEDVRVAAEPVVVDQDRRRAVGATVTEPEFDVLVVR